jgi:hypothetical protein
MPDKYDIFAELIVGHGYASGPDVTRVAKLLRDADKQSPPPSGQDEEIDYRIAIESRVRGFLYIHLDPEDDAKSVFADFDEMFAEINKDYIDPLIAEARAQGRRDAAEAYCNIRCSTHKRNVKSWVCKKCKEYDTILGDTASGKDKT